MPEFLVLRTANTLRPAGCIRPIFLSCWTRLILIALQVLVSLQEVKRIVYLASLMLFRMPSIQTERRVYRFRPGDAGFFRTLSMEADKKLVKFVMVGFEPSTEIGGRWEKRRFCRHMALKTKPGSGRKGD